MSGQRVTIINGGTQGLGEAVARRIALDGGAALVLTGRSADRGLVLADELTAAGTPSVFVCADIADDSSPQRIVDAALMAFGVVHQLVNVAATTTRANSTACRSAAP